MADLTVNVLTFQNSLVLDPNNWPKLSCVAANQLALEVSNLRLDGDRELFFRNKGQIRSFDDHHRLVFDPFNLKLEIHEQGDISFLTGGPTTTERMVILADGNVGVGVSNPGAPLEVAGFIRASGGLESNAANKMQVGTRQAQPLELVTNNKAAMTIDAAGKIGVGVSNPGAPLEVAGFIRASGGLESNAANKMQVGTRQAQPLELLTNNKAAMTIDVAGKIGVGIPNPGAPLEVAGFIRASGGLESNAANKMQVGTRQAQPLELLTNNKAAMTIDAAGKIGIGTSTPDAKLDVRGEIRAGNSDLYFTNPEHNHTGIGNTLGFAAIENAKDYNALMILGRQTGTIQGRAVRLWDYLQVNGPLDVTGKLTVSGNAVVSNAFLGNVGHGYAWAGFSHKDQVGPSSYGLLQSQDGLYTLINKKSGSPGYIGFRVDNNDKVIIGDNGNIFWAFSQFFGGAMFSGAVIFGGPKVGYVVDHFVNRVGDTLEQGDVVVISRSESSIYSGADNNIPLPEVDLTTKAYDTRVCGIVANAVTEQELPFAEAFHKTQFTPEARALSEGAVVKGKKHPSHEHPLKQFAAQAGAAQDRRNVQDQQIGMMATLGAYAHCKVDADIAPINVGDLLTTSPTKGHAQKALDPAKAVGAMIGKALGSLKKGKGKIPVLVILQ